MLVAGLIFPAFMAIIRQLGSDMHPTQIAFLRYGFGLVFMLPFLLRLGLAEIRAANIKMHILRGVLYGCGVLFWFYAMARVPIAEVTALGFMTPIYVTIGAVFLLGEKVRGYRIAAVGLGLLGALIILKPGISGIDSGLTAMLIASPIFAVAELIAKILTRRESGPALVGYLSIVVTVVLAGPAFWFWRAPTPQEWFLLSLTAGLATLGHLAFTHAFKIAEMSAVQPAKFVQLIWAALVGYLVFQELPELTTWIGSAVIVAAISYMAHREVVVARRRVAQAAQAPAGDAG